MVRYDDMSWSCTKERTDLKDDSPDYIVFTCPFCDKQYSLFCFWPSNSLHNCTAVCHPWPPSRRSDPVINRFNHVVCLYLTVIQSHTLWSIICGSGLRMTKMVYTTDNTWRLCSMYYLQKWIVESGVSFPSRNSRIENWVPNIEQLELQSNPLDEDTDSGGVCQWS